MDLSDHELESLTQQGGNIRKRMIKRLGGYATSAIEGLSKLGAETTLITSVDNHAYSQLEEWLPKTDLSLVRKNGVPGKSIVIESTNKEGELVKIMIDSDLDSNSEFGPSDLTSKDIEKINESDYVLVGNWGVNTYGTELLREVTQLAKASGTYTFLEAGDVSGKDLGELRELVDTIEDVGLDFWAMNEDEVRQFAYAIENEYDYGSAKSVLDLYRISPLDSAKVLQKELKKTKILMHSKDYSWMEGQVVPTYNIKEIRTTGAGDTWNAGFIYGHYKKLKGDALLKFANASGGFLVANGYRPSFQEVVEFIQNNKLRSQELIPTEQPAFTDYTQQVPIKSNYSSAP
ncbi:MAG: carbohydrate kinase family protein [Candidatus Altiarchaeota archaeon]|nr:carbohydrate kinase family protein [Candidatus Altiarchaeota archaeon]